eukprot:gnl/TRDRNA2_/TRDRNA2_168654_c2_seq1.p2 gnl/TRDRNA2_/TRDRNA2_168654_c2~~gnl/TRDRNA2_/TRDRNA2_168654_c2_seq1.p2  ORF type:complete len:148 (+),score=12.01 gnl/TRDRNA2_/TRDRNA2_168654_c2_seq1:392-835(+)
MTIGKKKINLNSTWEKRASALFSFLNHSHPHGIIWKTAHVGYSDPKRANTSLFPRKTPCGTNYGIRDAPTPENEINETLFDGSWKQIPNLNRVYKEALHKYLPDAIVLDIAPLSSMRGDCRTDFIHFDWHNKKAPVHMWSRMLQSFM